MTSTVSANMRTHIDGPVTSLAMCWKIIRVDGQEFYFTNHDQDLTVDGDVYLASEGFEQTAIQNSADMSVDNLEVDGVLSTESGGLDENDLRGGLFNYAAIEIFLVNWQDVAGCGIWKRKRGRIGIVSTASDGTFKAQLDGLLRNYQQNLLGVYGYECDVDLFSAKCGLNKDDFKWTGSVTSATDRRNFVVSLSPAAPVDDYFNYGVLKWATGSNAGLVMEVKNWTQSTNLIELFLAMPFEIQAGDQFDVYAGCDHTPASCKAFGNYDNYRGFPDVPGQDQLFTYPDAQ